MNITDPATCEESSSTPSAVLADVPAALRSAPLLPGDVTGVSWQHRFLYGFLTGEGCAGVDAAGVYASEVAHPRGTIEVLRTRLESVEAESRRETLAVPLPDPNSWNGTVGELWDAYEDATERRSDARRVAATRAELAERSSLAEFGLVPLGDFYIEFHGWEFGSADPHLPLAVIVNHSCRCACGGAFYDVDDDDADSPAAAVPAGSWVAELPDGRVVLSSSGGCPDAERFTASVAAAAAEFDRVVADAAAAAETAAASVLDPQQVEALSVAEFKEYVQRLGIRFWGRRVELRPAPNKMPAPAQFDEDEVARAAHRAFKDRLAADGFHVSSSR